MEFEHVNPERKHKLKKRTIEQLNELADTAVRHFPLDLQPDRTERFDRFDQRKELLEKPDDSDS